MRLAFVLVTAGCAVTLPKQPKPDAVVTTTTLDKKIVAVPGETMEYQVDLRGVTIGRVMVAVGQPGWVDGHRAIVVRTRGTSAGLLALFISELRWELTSTLDLDSGELVHEKGENWVTLHGKQEHDSYDRAGTSGAPLNVHGAAGLLRAWRSRVGDRTNIEMRIEDAQFGVDIWDEAHEMLGSRPAVRYTGMADLQFPFSVWISDDEARVPLYVRTESKWGTIAIELVLYDLTTTP